MAPFEKKPKSGLVLLITALAVGAGVYFGFDYYESVVVDGSYVGAHYLGASMLLITKSRARGARYRLDLVDLATGTRRLRKAVGRGATCFAHDTDRLWMHDEKYGVHARSPKTLDLLLTQAEIEKRNPQIRDGIRKGSWRWDADAKQLFVESRHGDPFFIDPSTGAATVTSAREKLPVSRGSWDELVLKSGDSLTLGASGLTMANAEHNVYTPLDPTLSSGKFALDRCEGHPLRMDPESYLVARAIGKGDFFHQELIRLLPDGKRMWTATLPVPDGDLTDAHLDGKQVILIFESPERAAFAIDAVDGQKLWRYQL